MDGKTLTYYNYYTIIVTGPRKTPLNAGVPKFIFIVESDKAFSKLQNDTKIDLLAIFYREICSRERYEVLQRPLE